MENCPSLKEKVFAARLTGFNHPCPLLTWTFPVTWTRLTSVDFVVDTSWPWFTSWGARPGALVLGALVGGGGAPDTGLPAQPPASAHVTQYTTLAPKEQLQIWKCWYKHRYRCIYKISWYSKIRAPSKHCYGICYSSSQLPDIYLSMVEDQFGFLSNFYLCFNNKWLMSKRCLIIDHRSKYKMRGNCAMGLKDSLEEAKKRFCCIQRILIIIYNWVLKGSLCVAISSLWTDAKICQKMRWSSEMWMVMKKHRGLNQLCVESCGIVPIFQGLEHIFVQMQIREVCSANPKRAIFKCDN